MQLLAAGLLSLGLGGTAQSAATFERKGVIEEFYLTTKQVKIDGQRYDLATDFEATDRDGNPVTLKQGMRVRFSGSMSSNGPQIQNIRVQGWYDPSQYEVPPPLGGGEGKGD